MSRWQNEEDRAWRLIFGGKPKYTKTYVPRTLPNAPVNTILPPENQGALYTSPFAQNAPWRKNNKSNNKKFSTVVVQSNKPLTTTEHNRLLNKIKQVTAV